jgi:hypothetical protein
MMFSLLLSAFVLLLPRSDFALGQRSLRNLDLSISKKISSKASIASRPDFQEHHLKRYSSDTQQVFQNIYDGRVWSDEGRGSGIGSTRAATMVTTSIIRSVAAKCNVSIFIDAPCGKDLNTVDSGSNDQYSVPMTTIQYQGIAANQSSQGGRNFLRTFGQKYLKNISKRH